MYLLMDLHGGEVIEVHTAYFSHKMRWKGIMNVLTSREA